MTRAALHEPQEISQPRRTQQRAPERLQAREPERVSERHEERRLERPSNRNLTDDGRFSLDRNLIPKGYVMEFKRHSIMGMQDTRNQVLLASYHWKPVPHKMQPQILGHLCKDENQHIIVDGLGLYMRPRYLNDEANEETRRDTDYQLEQQVQSLRLSSKQQVGAANTKIKKSVVSVPQEVE